MNEYFVQIFVMCIVTGILGLISYNEKNSAERAALGVILLFVTLSPAVKMLSELDVSDFDPEKIISEIDTDSELSEVGAGALKDGICRAVCERFSFADDEVSATLYGFDFKDMRADVVRIVLSGRAVLADSKAIKKYVDEMGGGACEIELKLGG